MALGAISLGQAVTTAGSRSGPGMKPTKLLRLPSSGDLSAGLEDFDDLASADEDDTNSIKSVRSLASHLNYNSGQPSSDWNLTH